MHIRTPGDLGALIRERRRSCGWDQQKLADEIGTSRQWVIEIEKGKPRAEVGLVLMALNALGVDLLSDSVETNTGHESTNSVNIDDIVERARGTK